MQHQNEDNYVSPAYVSLFHGSSRQSDTIRLCKLANRDLKFCPVGGQSSQSSERIRSISVPVMLVSLHFHSTTLGSTEERSIFGNGLRKALKRIPRPTFAIAV